MTIKPHDSSTTSVSLFLCISLLYGLGAISGAWGQCPIEIPGATALNINAQSDQEGDSGIDIAFDLSKKNAVAVWTAIRFLDDGLESEVLFATSANYGKSWSFPQRLASNRQNDQIFDTGPRVLHLGSGRFLIVWQTISQFGLGLGSDSDIVFVLSNDLGSTWTDPQPISTEALVDSAVDRGPKIAKTSEGVIIASWFTTHDFDGALGSDFDIVYSYSLDNAESWSVVQAANSNAPSDSASDIRQDVYCDPTGQCILVWSSGDPVFGGGGGVAGEFDIAVASWLSSTKSWSVASALNSNSFTDSGYDIGPVISEKDGVWLVVWQTTEATFGGGSCVFCDSEILVSRSTDSGASWSSPSLANPSTAFIDDNSDAAPDIASNSAGDWVIVWSSGLGADPMGGVIDEDILAVFSDDGGLTWSDICYVNLDAETDSTRDDRPRVFNVRPSEWLAVWSSFGEFGSDDDLLMTRFPRPNGITHWDQMSPP